MLVSHAQNFFVLLFVKDRFLKSAVYMKHSLPTDLKTRAKWNFKRNSWVSGDVIDIRVAHGVN